MDEPGVLLARPPAHADPGVAERMTLVGAKRGTVAAEELLKSIWSRVLVPDRSAFETITALNERFGVHAEGQTHMEEGAPTPSSVLAPGLRVCFTGTVVLGDGAIIFREEMEKLALDHGLLLSANMTKTKTDVLVVAESGTQSGKAKKAAQFGKPVILAKQFLEWCDAN